MKFLIFEESPWGLSQSSQCEVVLNREKKADSEKDRKGMGEQAVFREKKTSHKGRNPFARLTTLYAYSCRSRVGGNGGNAATHGE